jgi:hypothetical protein
MPPEMPPILTGGHPPSGNIEINAAACIIVKWQQLYSETNNGVGAARLRLICGVLPAVLLLRSFAFANGKGEQACAVRVADVT